MTMCGKLQAVGVASNCTTEPVAAEGIWLASVERVHFDLVNVPGKGGYLARFEKEEHAASVITVLDGMSTLAGRNHFQEGKLVIQMNVGAPPADVSAARAILSGHTPDPVPKVEPPKNAAPPAVADAPKTTKQSGKFSVTLVGSSYVAAERGLVVAFQVASADDGEHPLSSATLLEVSTPEGLQGELDAARGSCSGTMPPNGKFVCTAAFKLPADLDGDALVRVALPDDSSLWFRVAPKRT